MDETTVRGESDHKGDSEHLESRFSHNEYLLLRPPDPKSISGQVVPISISYAVDLRLGDHIPVLPLLPAREPNLQLR
jgi:hypothetical protein